jgi:glycerophosphoryl diester phosphodiesterase
VLHLRAAAEGGLQPSDVVALRGGSPDYPESVLAAYRDNLRAGVCLDANIRKTADGEIVVVHDQTTGRYCEHDWTIADRTVAELQSLDAAFRFDPAGNGTFPLRGQGYTFPRLEEVLQLFVRSRRPGAFIWIDTKDDEDYTFAENQQLYDRLIELLDRYHLWEEARIEVSKACEAEALRQRDQRVRVVYWGANVEDVLDALEYPHYERIGVSRKTAAAVAGRIHAAGKKLHIADKRWTPDDLQAVRRFNPSSLGTNDYARMMQLLQEIDQQP